MKPAESQWLVPLLDQIRTRPGAFLGGARELQPGVFSGGCYDVGTLALYCAAYAEGRDSIAERERVPRDSEYDGLMAEFADWLAARGSARNRLPGWVGLVMREAEARGEANSVQVFYALFDEFRRERG